jgi:uncharacterized membrane protein (UPF0127 family)
MKKTFLTFVLLVVLGIVTFLYLTDKLKEKPVVVIAGQEITVAIANTPALQAKGLSGTKRLRENEGMLFIFAASGRHGFWMKDMNYSLDIIWLDETGRVVHLEKEVAPETYPEVFTPSAPARYVLEVNAGFAEKYDLKVGDSTKLL